MGGSDALLQFAHLGSERGLVTHRRGHAPEQRGNFRPAHHKAEDVVNEEQHVPALIAVILRHGQPGQGHAQAHAGRFVHLPEHHHRVFHHAGLNHLPVELGAFARALADAREDGITGMLLRD